MQNLQYRPYQEECLDAIESAGAGKHLIALATGLGKTVIFTGIPNRGRTLILSHRDELVRQPEKYYKGRGISFGIEKADEHANGEDIVSASIQSLSQDTRLNSYAADTFDTVIVDEAHHAAAPTYRKVLDHFSGATRILGFTATPSEETISVCHAFLTILSLTGISVGALRTDIFHAYAAKKSADNTAWLESRKQTAITARRR